MTVVITAIEREDLPKLKEWRNDYAHRRHYRQFRLLSDEMQEKWFSDLQNDQDTIMFAIRADGQLVGCCGLTYMHWKNRIAELSLYTDRYQSVAYAYDALKLLVEYGFRELGMHKLWVDVYEFDERKIALCHQFGFILDGVLRDNLWREGRYWNSHIYSLLEHDRIET